MSVRQLQHSRYTSMHYPAAHGLYRAEPLSPLGPSLLPFNDGSAGTQMHSHGHGHIDCESLYAKMSYGLSSTSPSTSSSSFLSSSSALSPTKPSQLATDPSHHQYFLTQKNTQMQQEVASARNEHARLESQVFELNQTIAEMRKENFRLLRAKKDYDKQMERNTIAFDQERALWQEREQELVRSLKFATRPLIVQPPKEELLDLDGDTLEEVLPAKIQQQIAENNAAQQRALRSEEKRNDELRGQLLRLNNDFVEQQRLASAKDKALREENAQLRELNQNLMEENESFQMLLHEKTLNGELMQTGIMRMSTHGSDSPNPSNHSGSINLADELGRAFGSDSEASLAFNQEHQTALAKLQEENGSLKEAMRALQVYINKILSRIMEHPHSQRILAADYSPSRAAIPDSPIATIKKNNNSTSMLANEYKGSDSNRSSTESQDKQTSASTPHAPPKADKGRARSSSLFSRWSIMKPKPAPEKPVLEEESGTGPESASSGSAALSFQEGHIVDDSPRTSSSSSQEFSVEAAPQRPTFDAAEYEQLTTFDQPFTRKQLQRHASLGAAAAADRHRRRQTVGYAPTSSGRHDRYGSESDVALPLSRRAMHVKSRSSMATVEATSVDFSSSSTTLSNVQTKVSEARIDEEEAETAAPMTSPKLSISTSSTATSGASSGLSSPSTAPTDNGVLARARRRLSLFGASNPTNPPVQATSVGTINNTTDAKTLLAEEPESIEASAI
ncbi:hypothetical protein BGZ73_003390 [Actinomortierella ambigua]|nr:hypothetical protein BGZ73_003390 [Actinomortierella ambigua]